MWILINVLIIILIFTILYFAIGIYFYNFAINRHVSKDFVGLEEPPREEKERREKWISDNSKDVYIRSTHNGELKLHSYEIKAKQKTSTWVIVIHGYSIEGKGMQPYAEEFFNRGYNVLLVDLRGAGKSEGHYIGMGWHERFDTIDWINYLIKKDKDCKIILYGISMGAATVMMTTGEKLPKNVRLAIEDCGYTSVYDIFAYQVKKVFKLPPKPILAMAGTVTKIKAGYSYKEASCMEQVKKSKTPTLFIHGDKDDFVKFDMLDELYNQAKCKKEKLVIEDAEHAESAEVNPEKYWSKIDSFIKKYI